MGWVDELVVEVQDFGLSAEAARECSWQLLGATLGDRPARQQDTTLL
jgi:hypothetical protein